MKRGRRSDPPPPISFRRRRQSHGFETFLVSQLSPCLLGQAFTPSVQVSAISHNSVGAGAMKTRRSVPGRTGDFLRGFREQDGAVAVQFALLIVPLTITVFGAMDVSRASGEKMRLQDALDAATLAAARSTATTDAGGQAVGEAVLAANLAASQATLTRSSFVIVDSKVVATARGAMPTVVANLWMAGDMTIGAESEGTRASNNIEVALTLDVTGSMGGQKITDLKAAARDLVDLVVP